MFFMGSVLMEIQMRIELTKKIKGNYLKKKRLNRKLLEKGMKENKKATMNNEKHLILVAYVKQKEKIKIVLSQEIKMVFGILNIE